MGMTLEGNADKLLILLSEMPFVKDGSIERDFQDTVRIVCQQIKNREFGLEQEDYRITPMNPLF